MPQRQIDCGDAAHRYSADLGIATLPVNVPTTSTSICAAGRFKVHFDAAFQKLGDLRVWLLNEPLAMYSSHLNQVRLLCMCSVARSRGHIHSSTDRASEIGVLHRRKRNRRLWPSHAFFVASRYLMDAVQASSYLVIHVNITATPFPRQSESCTASLSL